MKIDRKKFFDAIRVAPFPGKLSQGQVDGMNLVLDYWERSWVPMGYVDLRHLSYLLATDQWETAHTMQPIGEYGMGKGKPYGEVDLETGQAYYGRGLVQLTWRDNYRRATQELGLTGADDLEWHADRALDPSLATRIIFEGMREGWFTGKKLANYFDGDTNDALNARQIVNGNDHDDDIQGLHEDYLDALTGAAIDTGPTIPRVAVAITVPVGVELAITVNGKAYG